MMIAVEPCRIPVVHSKALCPASGLRRTPFAIALSLAWACGATSASPLPMSSFIGAAVSAAETPRYALRRAQRVLRSDATFQRVPIRSNTRPTGNVLPVTSCADDGSPDTLRSVIATAGEGDTIDLSALTCSTITLTQGAIDLSVLGDHPINDLSIVGPGAGALTLDGNGDRVLLHGDFQIGLGTLSVSDLTVANGNYTHGLASCIDSSGRVELTRAVVTGCTASGGGPLTFGGAVSAAYLTMTSSTISDSGSSAAGDNVAIGGGAYVSGDATLVDSTISGNVVCAETPGDGTFYITAGGGLYVRGALEMKRSTISGNSVQSSDILEGPGGGIFVRADAAIESSTFDDNRASQGGGLYKAVFSHYGDPGTTLTITNSTFAANGAYYGGGALVTRRPSVILSSSIAFNGAGLRSGGVWCRSNEPDLALQSTIIANNGYGDIGNFYDLGADVPFTVTGANNLVIATGATMPADTIDGDPLLAPLSDNGGPTWTLALGEGSPAIDAGNNAAAQTFDQRGDGFPRVSGAAADIGAFEVQQAVDDRLFADGFELSG